MDQTPRARISRPHLDELDVVRPVASLLVIVTHTMQAFASGGSLFYGAILLESEASRHIFFFVSAMVLTYQAYGRSRWSAGAFWWRRFTSVYVPFILWVLIYALLGLAGLRGLTIPEPPVTGAPLHVLERIGIMLATGPGHLYFVAVLAQFYLVFPVLLWVLNRARRYHLALAGAALAAQVALTVIVHYRHVSLLVWQDVNATREVTSYTFYLVTGAVAGAHLTEVRDWAWRHRRPLAAGAVLVAAGVEAWYVLTVRAGTSPGAASDPFEPELIASYVADIVLLWLAGAWWAARQRDGWRSRLVRTLSDNSFGVYLSHAVFLDIAITSAPMPHVPWPARVLIALAATWCGGNLLTVVLARTPLSRWLTGRARRPLTGGPPPAGRGTVAEPDRSISQGSEFPEHSPAPLR